MPPKKISSPTDCYNHQVQPDTAKYTEQTPEHGFGEWVGEGETSVATYNKQGPVKCQMKRTGHVSESEKSIINNSVTGYPGCGYFYREKESCDEQCKAYAGFNSANVCNKKVIDGLSPKIWNNPNATAIPALGAVNNKIIKTCPNCDLVPWGQCQEGCSPSRKPGDPKTTRNWCANNNIGRAPSYCLKNNKTYTKIGTGYCSDKKRKQQSNGLDGCAKICKDNKDCKTFSYQNDNTNYCITSNSDCNNRITNNYPWTSYKLNTN